MMKTKSKIKHLKPNISNSKIWYLKGKYQLISSLDSVLSLNFILKTLIVKERELNVGPENKQIIVK